MKNFFIMAAFSILSLSALAAPPVAPDACPSFYAVKIGAQDVGGFTQSFLSLYADGKSENINPYSYSRSDFVELMELQRNGWSVKEVVVYRNLPLVNTIRAKNRFGQSSIIGCDYRSGSDRVIIRRN